MPQRYLHISKRLHWDSKEKRYVLWRRDGVTVRGAEATQTLLKEAIWAAKQRRKRERKESKRALTK